MEVFVNKSFEIRAVLLSFFIFILDQILFRYQTSICTLAQNISKEDSEPNQTAVNFAKNSLTLFGNLATLKI